jgi:hypothetical protein
MLAQAAVLKVGLVAITLRTYADGDRFLTLRSSIWVRPSVAML